MIPLLRRLRPHRARDLGRFPLPVSSATSPIVERILLTIASFSAGLVCGVLGYAFGNLHGLLP